VLKRPPQERQGRVLALEELEDQMDAVRAKAELQRAGGDFQGSQAPAPEAQPDQTGMNRQKLAGEPEISENRAGSG
jgi:hypothetical protein